MFLWTDRATLIAIKYGVNDMHRTIADLRQRLERIELMVANNYAADVAAITAQTTVLGSVKTAADKLNGQIAALNSEISDLKASNPGLDTSDLDAAVASLTGVVTSLTTAIPANTPAA